MKTKRYFSAATDAETTGTRESDDQPSTTFHRRPSQKKFENDPYPGDAPIAPEKIEEYKWGEDMQLKGIKTNFAKKKFEKKRTKIQQSARQAARTEILLNEDAGFLEADEGEYTYRVSQKEIADNVDIASATKYFELDLPRFGPYRINYTRNGRHLLLGGKRGHVAAFDWQTKRLHCETNVMESVRDVQWLHIETMYAVAQKRWTYIYDSQGVELHCLKQLHDVVRLEFLPYHFLLVAATGSSFLHWLDVSIGKLVQSFPTKLGQLDVMCQNPANAIVHCGHAGGTVSLWSPNMNEPLVRMLCHRGPIRGVTVDATGHYMATTGLDREIRVWDLRQYKQLTSSRLSSFGLGPIAFSQKKLLACAVGTSVQIFKDVCTKEMDSPYLVHNCRNTVTDLQFCPYEDILGVGHQAGFASLLVPGAGEANLDALEANPFQSKDQRREFEVKALLDKIQPEMISLNSSVITEVDTERLEEKLEDRAKILYLKPDKIEFKPKHKAKGKSSAANRVKRKKGVEEGMRRKRNEEVKEVEEELLGKKRKVKTNEEEEGPKSVLDRFKRKDV